MYTKNINKLLIITLALMAQNAPSAPLNQECEGSTNPAVQDCTNDPFMTTWEMDFMNFSYAWDKSYGTARVAIIDSYVNNSAVYSAEFGSRLRNHNTGHFSSFINHPGYIAEVPNSFGDYHYLEGGTLQYTMQNGQITPISHMHGDMVLSLLGSQADNGTGMASTCRECSLAYYGRPLEVSTSGGTEWQQLVQAGVYDYKALHASVLTGNQIINLSGAFKENLSKCSRQVTNGYGDKQPLCVLLEYMHDFDTIMVASNGNNRSYSANWPANEDEYVIGVGGSDNNKLIWDLYRDQGHCPYTTRRDTYSNTTITLSINYGECGSQLNNNLIMAPAKDIMVYHHNGSYSVSTHPQNPNWIYNNGTGCLQFSNQYLGYQTCSGTSFSAPIITGVVSNLRSLNPLLSFEEIQFLLKTSRVYTDNQTGYNYSIPNIAALQKNNVLGFFNGTRVSNRLKPMFRLNTRFYHDDKWKNNYLSTSIPQIAATAMKGFYLADVNKSNGYLRRSHLYSSDTAEPLAVGYPKFREPDMDIKADNARAPFYIFGGHENPFTGADDMKPLYHFALKPVISNYPECHDLADHAYATVNNPAFLINPSVRCNKTDTNYVWEGIEGYLLPSCPKGQTCYETDNNPESPQCLMLRYSSADDSYALVMESELQSTKFSSYTGTADHLSGMGDSECLGYVYPNVDSDNDLIIDGMELVLGTDPNDEDSDLDGVWDGVEYPPTSPIISNPLDSNSF